MNPSVDTKQALRDWVVKKSGKVRPDQLRDDTPIIEQRIITSLQVMDLLLFIESLTGRPVDVNQLHRGAFRDIDTIHKHFCKEESNA